MQTVSVVVPFLNEGENLARFCEYIDGQANKAEYLMEVIFVDDGSSDDSVKVIESYDFKHCNAVKLIKFSKNFGSHAAVRAGFSKSTGDYCTYLDADLETPVDILDVMYKNIINDFDAVYIEKKSVSKSPVSKIASGIYSVLMRRFAVPGYRSGGINHMMLNRKIVDYLNDNMEHNSSLQLQIINAGFKSIIIGMDYRSRICGKSKWTFSKKIKLFIDSFVSFSYLPIRMVSFIGFLLAFIGITYGIYLVILRIIYDDLQQGFATLSALLLFGFGLTNISLGIIAEYLWRTFDVSRNRPVFIISKEIQIKR